MVNSLYLDLIFASMNTTAMIPYRPIPERELAMEGWILKSINFLQSLNCDLWTSMLRITGLKSETKIANRKNMLDLNVTN